MDKDLLLGNDKYRSLIVSIVLFLTLIGGLLAFTFYTSNILEKNTALINASNTVANDAQSVIKDLFDMQLSYGEDFTSEHITTVLGRLKNNSQRIDEYIHAMETGGQIQDEAGHTITLPVVADTDLYESLAKTKTQWSLLKPKVDNYLLVAQDLKKDSALPLSEASEQAKVSSLSMNSSLKALTLSAYDNAENQATTIRLIQIIGIFVILGYFAVFILFFMRRLKDADIQTIQAQQETAEIMQTVNTGLFLLDRNLTIGNQYSNALENIIGAKNLAGEKLSSVLRNRISDKDLQTTEEFIEQLYNPKVKEKLVESLNPLQQVMFQNIGDNKTRYLDFKFSRVYDKKDITRILVNVNDVSDAVLLEQRLERERAQNDMQIEMLTTILNVSPTIINEFISNTYVHIQKMNDVLKNPGSSQFELEGKLKLLYREMHSLKGEASALKLHSFTKIASEAEHKLHELQNQGKLSGNDFLALTVFLDELLNLSNLIAGIGERINSTLLKPQAPTLEHIPEDDVLFYDASSETKPVQRSEFAEYLESFGADIAGRQNKQITVDASQIDSVVIPKRLATTVREICVQLLRNAIVHGIADSQQRIANGKSPVGHVSINAHIQGNECFVFSVEDDGRGIDYEIIREKLITSGRVTEEQAQELTQAQLLNVIFNSGFSTKSVVDEDSGRGVGLDIVKDRVKVAGGKISVESEKGKFCRFTIKLPLNAE